MPDPETPFIGSEEDPELGFREGDLPEHRGTVSKVLSVTGKDIDELFDPEN